MTKNQNKELVNCAISMMFLGARRLMKEPGYLYNKTLHIGLDEETIDEAVSTFVSTTHRTVYISSGPHILSNPSLYRGIPESRVIRLTDLIKEESDAKLLSANIIVADPTVSWGSLNPLLNQALFRVGARMDEFAIVKPFYVAKAPKEDTVTEGAPSFMIPYFWRPNVHASPHQS